MPLCKVLEIRIEDLKLGIESVYIGFIIIGFIAFIGYIQLSRDLIDLTKSGQEAAEKLAKEYVLSLGKSIDSPRYFTTGHPYVWVEISLEGLVTKLGERYRNEHPICAHKIDEEKGFIFIIPGKKEYDFDGSKLVTYEEYVGKNL